MKKTGLHILLIVLSFFSCKKQELSGDTSYLEGKWKLYAEINNLSSSVHYTDQRGKNVHYLEIKRNGSIILYNYQNKIIERGRIKSFTSEPANIYPNGIYYEIEMGSNSVFNRLLDKLTYLILISTNQTPYEFITNDIIYETPALELVFQKME